MERPMKKSKLPKTDSIQELAEFWDAHDLTDFEEELEEVAEPVFVRGAAIKVPRILRSRSGRANGSGQRHVAGRAHPRLGAAKTRSPKQRPPKQAVKLTCSLVKVTGPAAPYSWLMRWGRPRSP
jgi:hypothetical protein